MAPPIKPCRIVALTAENVKKLRAVTIQPDGSLVQITGRNGQGKTSVLDSIWWALAGAGNIQSQPIRSGENKARIKLDLGDIVVERRFTPAGSTVTVETAEGARYSSPQKLLDSLLGQLSFDPLAFSRMDERRKYDELRRIAKLDVDVEHLDALNASDFAKRTEKNRDAAARRAQAEGIVVPAEIQGGKVDTTALLNQMEQAGATNADIETRRQRRINASERVVKHRADAAEARQVADNLRAQIATLQAQLAEKEAAAVNYDEQAVALQKQLDEAPELPAPVDVSTLRVKLEAAQATNAAIDARAQALARRRAFEADAEALEQEAKALTDAMEARAAEKAAAIARAAMPVPGLSLGAGFVTYNGLPFDQASSAEQLRVSLAIAMAANPTLRVIRIKDGSLLDEDSMRLIGEMAADQDYQVWVEVVDTTGKVGFVVEDGEVRPAEAAANEPLAQTPASAGAAPTEAPAQGDLLAVA